MFAYKQSNICKMQCFLLKIITFDPSDQIKFLKAIKRQTGAFPKKIY